MPTDTSGRTDRDQYTLWLSPPVARRISEGTVTKGDLKIVETQIQDQYEEHHPEPQVFYVLQKWGQDGFQEWVDWGRYSEDQESTVRARMTRLRTQDLSRDKNWRWRVVRRETKSEVVA